MASLKTLCGLAAAMLILAGCGSGPATSSPSASATSTPPSATGSSGSTSGSTSPPASSGGSSGSSPPPSSPPPTSPPPTTGSATLKWTAPTTNSNGSALTDLAGYHIYYGTSVGSLSNKVSVTSASTLTYTVTGLGQGTWYFAITAYTNTGLESALSNVGSKTIS